MTTRTITAEVSIAQLKAALLFAPKSDVVRAYLVGVCFDYQPQRCMRLVATDGHRMIVMNLGGEPNAAGISSGARFVVSRDVLDRAVKAYAKEQSIQVTWSQDTDADPERPGVVIVRCAKITVGELPTTDVQDNSGRFPGYERIVPAKTSGKTAQFNALYLADCAKAADWLKATKRRDEVSGFINVAHNGDSAALVDLGESAFAIVMPCRPGAEPALPDWYAGAPAKAAA
jgi:DNA polymerase III sliding clamp (beta) subunit (PCNA family)